MFNWQDLSKQLSVRDFWRGPFTPEEWYNWWNDTEGPQAWPYIKTLCKPLQMKSYNTFLIYIENCHLCLTIDQNTLRIKTLRFFFLTVLAKQSKVHKASPPTCKRILIGEGSVDNTLQRDVWRYSLTGAQPQNMCCTRIQRNLIKCAH